MIAFFALAYLLSWLTWSPLVAQHFGWCEHVSPYWHLVGGLGPAIAALLLARRESPAALRELLQRCVQAPVKWVAVAFNVPVTLFLLAVMFVGWSGAAVDWTAFTRVAEYPALPFVAYVAVTFVAYGFGEEIGWRGYALRGLLARRTSVQAALLVALGWAAWHAPLFLFSPGMSQMGVGGAIGWAVSIMAGSFLMTWLYLASHSVLAPALFHASLDIFMSAPISSAVQGTMGALVTIAGFAVVPLLLRRPATFAQGSLNRRKNCVFLTRAA